MNNLKISTRLVMLTGIMSVLLIVIGSIGLFGIGQSNDALKTVYEDRTVCLGQLDEIQRLMLRNRLAVATALSVNTPAEISKILEEVDPNSANINKIWTEYSSTYLTPDEAKLAKDFAEARTKFIDEALKPAIAALRANNKEVAQRLVLETVPVLYSHIRHALEGLIQLQLDVAKSEYDAAVVRYSTIRMVAIGSIAAGLVFAVLFGLALIRGISRSLNQAIDTANAVAQGDLSTQSGLKARTKWLSC